MNPVIIFCENATTSHSDEALVLWHQAWEYDHQLAMRSLFWLLDIGESELFRYILMFMSSTFAYSYILNNIHLIVEYGSWGDLWTLLSDSSASYHLRPFIKSQILHDLKSDTPSLLAKWMPSENSTFLEAQQNARKLRELLEMSPQDYSQLVECLEVKINATRYVLNGERYSKIKLDTK